MLFPSIQFLFYFLPAVLLLYLISGFSRSIQNICLFISSLIFYAWGEPLYTFLLLLSIAANWGAGLAVESLRDTKHKKAALAVVCAFNIGLLVFFKYSGFISEIINACAGFRLLSFTPPALPLGISFYTFQGMSYVIDIYRGDYNAEKSPLYVGLYISFFPQLIAGPIVRYPDISARMRDRRITADLFSEGCRRFVSGLSKKVLIADPIAVAADVIFGLSGADGGLYRIPALLAWLGIISYTLQIFFDFSGYSDMATGLGMMFGFRFRDNFDYPYVSRSVSEFWNRWHISLSSWFREYVYYPLGGSRVSNNDLMVRNTFIVWLLTGIWHGAGWTFIIWGMWNFILIITERAIKYDSLKIPASLRHLLLILCIMAGWVLFRSPDVNYAAGYLLDMLGLNGNGFFSQTALMLIRENSVFYFAAVLLCTPIAGKARKLMESGKMGIWGGIMALLHPIGYSCLFIICVIFIAKGGYSPFIYFNF